MAKSTGSSTISSTFKRSHSKTNMNPHHRHHHNGASVNENTGKNNTSGGLGLGTVTRVCGNKIHQNYQQHHNPSGDDGSASGCNNDSKHGHRHTFVGRHNVAIATQVISPSAFGESMKISGRRFCKHVDAEADDDDNQGLFTKKSRIPWGKLSCYGISIGIILVILTGVVLAVGYMQSEKQRILTQSQKFSQAYAWNVNDQDNSNIDNKNNEMTPTTWRPKVLFENVTVVPIIAIKNTISRESLIDDDANENLTVGGRSPNEERSFRVDSEDDDDDGLSTSSEEDIEELEIYQVPSASGEQQERQQQQSLNIQETRNSEQTLRLLTQSVVNKERMEEEEDKEGEQVTDDNNNKSNSDDQHKSPSEVKVLPPKDFAFQGFSFEFPIYNQSDTTTAISTSTPHDDNIGDKNNTFPAFSLNHQSTNPTLSILSSSLHPISSTTIKFPLVDLNFTLNSQEPSIVSNQSQSSIVESSSNHQNNNNHFELHFIHHLKELQAAIDSNENSKGNGKSNEHNNNNNLGSSSSNENSFTVPSPRNELKLQTELFSDEDEPLTRDEHDGKHESEQDLDTGEDSTMSASNKMRDRNPPSVKPSDKDNISYTPRPGSISSYPDRPDRPNRLYSSRTRNPNRNNNNEDNGNIEGFTLPKYYGSDKNEVRVPAPSTTTTSTTTAKPEFNFDFSAFTSPPKLQSSSSDNPSTSTDGKNGDSKSGLASSDTTHQFNFNFNSYQSTEKTTTTTTTTPSPTSFSFNEYQLLSSPSSSSSSTNNNPNHFNFDFSQLTTPAPPTGATPTPAFQLTSNPDSLSKRTFNFDFDTSASSSSNFNSNPFAHLLGNQAAITGVIGTTSPTGAGLGYGQNNNFNFDTSSFNTNYDSGGHNIPSGTIPLDLASSYIQAGNPPPLTSNTNYGQNSYNNFDYTGSYSNTNPTFPSFTQQNYGQGGTSGGQNSQPNYNTITQGIHLLSLLSGNIPQHLLDSQSSASNNNNQFNFQQPVQSKPQYEIAALAGYGGSNTAFLNNLPSQYSSSSSQPSVPLSESAPTLNLNLNLSPYVPAESRSLFTFGNDLHSSKSLPADQQTSFSQKIATVSKLPNFSNIHKKSTSSSDSDTSESVAVPSSALSPSSQLDAEKTLSSILKLEENLQAQKFDMPKSSNKKFIGGSSATTNSKGALDMETAASDIRHMAVSTLINLIPDKPVINFSKKLLSKTTRTSSGSSEESATSNITEKGLKSGFYT